MSIYDDAKTHPSLVAAVAIASFSIAWAAFEAYGKLSGIDRVSANTYVLLKDLRDTHVPRTEHDKAIEALQNQVAGTRESSTRFERCSTDLQNWKTGLGQWKQASEDCQATLAATIANCSILREVRRLEQQKEFLDRDAGTLSSSGVNGNPSDGISKNNQIKLENVQQSIHGLEARILEVTKLLSCERKI
ncbi:hypothetical protein [Gallionella capsiferriformans]|uniref:Uncharacterized protein n=1 Tax=Gallionella capsiferriformans (strain ES-2) TaxID=395494 RepID=D9SG67_GALCS|nr:hypothetical protein [Gallionella capsiferriformans]ADL55514.1 hypothetical protein Galf_1495 [Gallionella capsiferriformans ES-2]